MFTTITPGIKPALVSNSSQQTFPVTPFHPVPPQVVPITAAQLQQEIADRKAERDLRDKQNTPHSPEQQAAAELAVKAANQATARLVSLGSKSWQEILSLAQASGHPITSGVDQKMVDEAFAAPFTNSQRVIISNEIVRLQALLA